MHISTVKMSEIVTDMANISLLFPSNVKSIAGFLLLFSILPWPIIKVNLAVGMVYRHIF